MNELLRSMFSSKKFIVFLATTATAIVVAVTGLGEDQAAQLVDKIINLAMAYMGGQGLADAGKYFGSALNGHGPKVAEAVKDAGAQAGAAGSGDEEE
jgi:hypothetical protein